MVNKDFFVALDELESTKGISKQFFIDALESALTSAYKKNFGEAKSASVKLVPEKNTIKIYSYKTVVEAVADPDKEISLAEAKLIKRSYKVGDVVQQEETPKNFGRIAAQTAKQVVMQKLREAEQGRIMNEVSSRQDQLVTGVVRRKEGESVYVDLGMTEVEGVMGPKDMIPGESYAINSRVKVLVRNVKESFGGNYVQLTRSNATFVRKLFELEVPEITSGEIEIKNIVREAGYRTKMAVFTNNKTLDPVGACIGNKGMRINSIVNELNGEKIDIVLYNDDPCEYIAAALSPATVIHMALNPDDKTCLAVVPDDKLSLAIGKSGQNVRLAARLTGWKIDVKAKSAILSLNLPEETENTETEKDDDFFNADVFDDLQ